MAARRPRRPGWTERLRALGAALLELLRAEAEALGADLRASGRGLGVVVLILAASGFAAFWACGLLAYALVEIAALWLPRWGAAASVFGLMTALAAGLVWVARFRLRKIERPATTVRRHLDDSIGWWSRRVLEGEIDEPSDGEAG